ncbi:DNA-binding HxlR family transcriptional regulator [Methanocalculus alkaliphilus]|uniref:winged helix-turn-helix transcriptional regulator n=1 Tax=Methanocalculus alkaliphilus TaxID=768730 RepID=UPI00209DBCE5|nr:helix-turn-helix domain-containing protein [Methanocalculus alkaliphilus]MCP1716132.1 DNA-binding HxlR family transcriptional regulator [Methanocalculus alkaliphilus]
MCRDTPSQTICPLRGILPLLSKKWALPIITTVGMAGSIRFTDIERILVGISPKTLTDTLSDLLAEGLLNRSFHAETPPRVEYSLTAEGAALCFAMQPLIEWAADRKGSGRRECLPACRVDGAENLCATHSEST